MTSLLRLQTYTRTGIQQLAVQTTMQLTAVRLSKAMLDLISRVAGALSHPCPLLIIYLFLIFI